MANCKTTLQEFFINYRIGSKFRGSINGTPTSSIKSSIDISSTLYINNKTLLHSFACTFEVDTMMAKTKKKTIVEKKFSCNYKKLTMTKQKTLIFCVFTLVHPSLYFNLKGDDGTREAMMTTPLK